ncbi:MAG: gliding motility protein GldN [Bacteroidia bacterium]|nr:gliding motility protein GldN [Bacteroidia bacterium]
MISKFRFLSVFALGFLFLALGQSASAQVMEPRDGVYDKVTTPSRRVVPYPGIREADVMWQRRIWRVIDLREKMNQYMYYPFEITNGRKNLITIIKEGIEKGELRPYDPVYDDFTVPLTQQQALSIGSDTIFYTDYRPYEPYEEFDTFRYQPLDYSSIKKFQVKEDWVFEKSRSVMETRIIGICPVREVRDPQTGEYRGEQPMYWIYFPELRRKMANEEVYNRFNNIAQQITYDDAFMKRLFSSYIYKEDNVYDRKIKDYMKNGMEALLENEDIKDKIRNYEHDLWEQ